MVRFLFFIKFNDLMDKYVDYPIFHISILGSESATDCCHNIFHNESK